MTANPLLLWQLYIAEKLNLTKEMYFAIALDRAQACPLVIASSKGGTSIEELAKTNPELILRLPINVKTGMTDEDALKIAESLQV